MLDRSPDVGVVAHAWRVFGAQMHQIRPHGTDPKVLLHWIRDELLFQIDAGGETSFVSFGEPERRDPICEQRDQAHQYLHERHPFFFWICLD